MPPLSMANEKESSSSTFQFVSAKNLFCLESQSLITHCERPFIPFNWLLIWIWSKEVPWSAKSHSSLLRKALSKQFGPRFWKHIQNKELSYIYILLIQGIGFSLYHSHSLWLWDFLPPLKVPFEQSDNHHASGCFEAGASPADQKITAHFHLKLGSGCELLCSGEASWILSELWGVLLVCVAEASLLF